MQVKEKRKASVESTTSDKLVKNSDKNSQTSKKKKKDKIV